MAKTTKTTVTKEELENKEVERELTPEETELAEFMETIPGGVLIKIFKVQNGRDAWCGDSDPRTVDENYLYRNFGAGRFHLKGFLNGKYFKGAYKEVVIYEPEVKPEDIAAGIRPFSGAMDRDGERDNERENDRLILFLDQVNKNQDRQMEMILEMIRAQGANHSRTEELIQLAQLFNKGPDITTLLPSMIDLFKTVMETSRDYGGSGKMGWLDVAMKGLDKLSPVVSQIMAGKMQNPAAAGETTMAQNGTKLLEQGIGWLKQRYRLGKDPLLQADFILDNLDNPVYESMAFELLNYAFDDFGKIDPEIIKEPMRQWFITVYNALHAGIRELQDAKQNETPAGESGGDADPSTDEEPDNSGDTQPSSPASGDPAN